MPVFSSFFFTRQHSDSGLCEFWVRAFRRADRNDRTVTLTAGSRPVSGRGMRDDEDEERRERERREKRKEGWMDGGVRKGVIRVLHLVPQVHTTFFGDR